MESNGGILRRKGELKYLRVDFLENVFFEAIRGDGKKTFFLCVPLPGDTQKKQQNK